MMPFQELHAAFSVSFVLVVLLAGLIVIFAE
jgi:hypothetical protein